MLNEAWKKNQNGKKLCSTTLFIVICSLYHAMYWIGSVHARTDSQYVLANYKTEPCKRPPRLCRQGYACPQFHNSKDRRRNPKAFKYRSTPCPQVKQHDEWGDPAVCDNGDNCQYCHTRTEQQFYPEVRQSLPFVYMSSAISLYNSCSPLRCVLIRYVAKVRLDTLSS